MKCRIFDKKILKIRSCRTFVRSFVRSYIFNSVFQFCTLRSLHFQGSLIYDLFSVMISWWFGHFSMDRTIFNARLSLKVFEMIPNSRWILTKFVYESLLIALFCHRWCPEIPHWMLTLWIAIRRFLTRLNPRSSSFMRTTFHSTSFTKWPSRS